MIKSSTKQKLALASAITLAFISVPAQSADGTLVISGQVNANTCKVNISDGSGVSPTNNGVRSVELGTVAPPTGTITPGTPFGTRQTATFSLTSSSGSGSCTISGTPANWNLVLDLQPNQVNSSISNKPFLTNLVGTNPATNVGVALFDNSGTQFSTLATGAGYLGTRLTNSTTGVSAGTNLTLEHHSPAATTFTDSRPPQQHKPSVKSSGFSTPNLVQPSQQDLYPPRSWLLSLFNSLISKLTNNTEMTY